MKILFYINEFVSPTQSNYVHNIVALAEGFSELNVEFFGNIDYWYIIDKNEFLIKKAPENFNPDINIYASNFITLDNCQINKLDLTNTNVIIDNEDGLFTSSKQTEIIEKFDIILRCHYNTHLKYAKNVYPWAFGLTNRMIEGVGDNGGELLYDKILDTFRVPHNLRALVNKEFYPLIKHKYPIEYYVSDTLDKTESINPLSYWSQTGRRHNGDYYKKINNYLFINTVGGIIDIMPIARNNISKFIRQKNKLLSAFYKTGYLHIYQFDSWRFWEGLLSNACPIHMDFESWSFVLPEMPQNRTHYWGIPKLSFKESAAELLKLSKNEVTNISKNGRNWALDYYSPKPTAQRLINLIDKLC